MLVSDSPHHLSELIKKSDQNEDRICRVFPALSSKGSPNLIDYLVRWFKSLHMEVIKLTLGSRQENGLQSRLLLLCDRSLQTHRCARVTLRDETASHTMRSQQRQNYRVSALLLASLSLFG